MLTLGKYRHYKGNDYEVLGVARHSETKEELVVYRALYGDFGLWVRPLAMFAEEVEVDGVRQPRFAYVGDAAAAPLSIALCGSMRFAAEMLRVQRELSALGHAVTVPQGTERYASGERDAETKWEKVEGDVIRSYFEKIKAVDAVLLVNCDKDGVAGYVGGNALIELAFAHVLGKRKFTLNPLPTGLSYSDEIVAMAPTVLNGDLRLLADVPGCI
jgi:hypothetical protein